MTREETKKMIMYLKSAYTGAFADADLSGVVTVWHDAFKDEATAVMNVAVRNYVKSNKFAPTIAGLQEQIDLIKENETGVDLWKYVLKALRNSTYNAKEEFEKLPEECKRFLGGASALKDMAMAESSVVNTVVKGQFLKQIENIKTHQKVQEGLPMEARQAIEESKLRMLTE